MYGCDLYFENDVYIIANVCMYVCMYVCYEYVNVSIKRELCMYRTMNE